MTISTEDSIKDTLNKIASTAGAQFTPEQQAELKKAWNLANDFERYLSKWMALESLELASSGVSQNTYMKAMCQALSAALTKMVVLAGWSDEIALGAFAASLREHRKGLTEQIEALAAKPAHG